MPDQLNDEERLQGLSEDNDTPFQPAAPQQDDTPGADTVAPDNTGDLDDTHPVTDTSVDAHEQYDEGVAGASEAGEPNAANAVENLIPEEQNKSDESPE